jgi:hypothetical protein
LWSGTESNWSGSSRTVKRAGPKLPPASGARFDDTILAVMPIIAFFFGIVI